MPAGTTYAIGGHFTADNPSPPGRIRWRLTRVIVRGGSRPGPFAYRRCTRRNAGPLTSGRRRRPAASGLPRPVALEVTRPPCDIAALTRRLDRMRIASCARTNATVSVRETPSRMARQASAVPVRPWPPAQAISTRSVAARSQASVSIGSTAASSAGRRKSGHRSQRDSQGRGRWAAKQVDTERREGAVRKRMPEAPAPH